MSGQKISISPGVTVWATAEMISMLNYIRDQLEISEHDLDNNQHALIRSMVNRSLLVRRRKNIGTSYQVRSGISWL